MPRTRRRAFGPGLLVTAASGATAGMCLGWLLITVALRRAYGASLPLWTFLRVLLACGAAVAVGRALPVGSRLATLGECAVIGLVYVVVLIVTRELGRRDLAQLKQVVSRKRKS